jgi:hypothetical protein
LKSDPHLVRAVDKFYNTFSCVQNAKAEVGKITCEEMIEVNVRICKGVCESADKSACLSNTPAQIASLFFLFFLNQQHYTIQTNGTAMKHGMSILCMFVTAPCFCCMIVLVLAIYVGT